MLTIEIEQENIKGAIYLKEDGTLSLNITSTTPDGEVTIRGKGSFSMNENFVFLPPPPQQWTMVNHGAIDKDDVIRLIECS